MILLGLDFGSSSIKAAILRGGRISGGIVRASYPTHFDGVRAEVDPQAVLKALRQVIRELGSAVKNVDTIALDVMSPSWLAMDRRGRPLTPIITHQDRRSVDVAKRLLKTIGKARILHLSGNLPFPGGISSTTWAWFAEHEPAVLKKADLVGHLSTFLHHTLTGQRVIDPSNASFMGIYSTLTLKGWNDELCDAVGVAKRLLPDVMNGNEIGGHITAGAAHHFGLTEGTPMAVGVMDTSAALLLRGAVVGQLLNVCGSTDVLALCTDRPKPNERLLTRALGVGKRWMHVSTLAAAGSALQWANRELFPDMTELRFWNLVDKLATHPIEPPIKFDPYLAGERTSIDLKSGGFSGLTLSSTRQQMLGAIIESLIGSSAERIRLLEATGTKPCRQVILSGGLQGGLSKVLHRDWPGRWAFKQEDEATLRGLSKLIS